MRELAALFGVHGSAYEAIVARRSSESPAAWAARHTALEAATPGAADSSALEATESTAPEELCKEPCEEPDQKRAKGGELKVQV